MPEQISKYPDVTLKVLKGAGARCGEGAEQKILTECPREQFCSLTTGEICVFGIDEIPKMTQITTQELARVVCPEAKGNSMGYAALGTVDVALLISALAVGTMIGMFWRKLGKRLLPASSSHLD